MLVNFHLIYDCVDGFFYKPSKLVQELHLLSDQEQYPTMEQEHSHTSQEASINSELSNNGQHLNQPPPQKTQESHEPIKEQQQKSSSASEKETNISNKVTPLQARLARLMAQGVQQSTYLEKLMCNMNTYFSNPSINSKLGQKYRVYSIIGKKDEDRLKFAEIFQEMLKDNNFDPKRLGLTLRESRGVAAVLGMGIGDALGSCTEFHHFNKSGLGIVKTGFADLRQLNRSGKVSVWTDDASMGLCMADSILLNDYHFNPTHMRYLFVLWLQHGLNNGGRAYSIGLGGNISISMYEFMRKQQEYTEKGDQFNNGNGSLMRLAPVPVAYANQPEKGIENSGLQSLTTHNGLQAKECARLMGKIIIELINRDPTANGYNTLLEVCNSFKSEVKSVQFLAHGQQESEEYYNYCCDQNKKFKTFNKQIQDRRWCWREQGHTYSPTRLRQQPGYIGSYCMDALAMALHTVLFSSSFAEVVIKNANMGGDCDTVGSIAGQIAGAMFGVDEGMLRLYSEMEDYTEGRYEVFLKGYKLINRKILP